MFDYHLHSKLSFDSTCEPCNIVAVAERLGLKEICFTDHYDFNDVFADKRDVFEVREYRHIYDAMESDRVKIRRGVEFGLTQWNKRELDELLASYNFDFVIGSVHYDEIMKTIAQKGIGMEINTSGVDRVGDFLPSIEFIKRFKELGGEIITVGSDAHDDTRVGQYISEALEVVKEVFGYVCTFEDRKVIYHKL